MVCVEHRDGDACGVCPELKLLKKAGLSDVLPVLELFFAEQLRKKSIFLKNLLEKNTKWCYLKKSTEYSVAKYLSDRASAGS